MKWPILTFALCLSLFSIDVYAQQNLSTFLPGEWFLNNAEYPLGGKMVISNCTILVCDFNLQSWYNSHICDIDGKLNIKEDYAEYENQKYKYDKKTDTEYFVSVGFLLEITKNNDISIRYSNEDSYNEFCGLNATVEGIWAKR